MPPTPKYLVIPTDNPQLFAAVCETLPEARAALESLIASGRMGSFSIVQVLRGEGKKVKQRVVADVVPDDDF